jgi:5-methylthioadenosine/S-adenosylhomocysteine deaminase
MRIRRVVAAALGVALACLCVAPRAGAEPSFVPGAPDQLLLRGVVVLPGGPIEREVRVEGKRIVCAAADCAKDGATVIETEGLIFPGLLNAHDHAAFNVLDEKDWNPGPIFKNHNEWPRRDARYTEVLAVKKHLEASSGADLVCEMDKYGELKAIFAGTTSILLAPKLTSKACFGSLARTINTGFNDLEQGDTIQTSISVPAAADATRICAALDAGTTKAYVVHVGEGIDEPSRKEFDTLAARAGGCLLRKETTVIHGTAFGLPEFQKMAARKMPLVWSPKSNLFLYKRADGSPATARIDAGVETIALGTDWALGGSVNLLDELRFAKQVATDAGWARVTDERLFRMVTIDAARALGVAEQLGSIEVGKRADLLVIPKTTADPYASLLDATPATVRLVIVDGRILYGEDRLRGAAPVEPPCERVQVCTQPKFVCVREAESTNKLGQTKSQIEGALRTSLAAYDAAHPSTRKFSPIAPLCRCGDSADARSARSRSRPPEERSARMNGRRDGRGRRPAYYTEWRLGQPPRRRPSPQTSPRVHPSPSS